MARKVLLVDDEAGFTQLLKMNLERGGKYEVRTENNPVLALSAAKAFKPDAILLDVVMPGMDGGDVQAQLEADPDMKDTPIIMVTALVDSTELSEGAVAQTGTSMVLPKPIDLKLLLRVLDDCIGK